MTTKTFLYFIFCLLGVLFCASRSVAQTPFKLLATAEKLYQKGNHQQALSKIEKAEKTPYCTCGDCSYQVNKQANLLKFQIYSSLENYSAARAALNLIDGTGGLFTEVDSLKILCYQAELGKDSLAAHIDTALEYLSIVCDEQEESCSVQLVVKDNILYLELSIEDYLACVWSNKQEAVKAKWLQQFKESSFYDLIKNEN